MALDVVDSVAQVSEALGQVHLEQVPQQVLQVRAEVGGKAHLGTETSRLCSVENFPKQKKKRNHLKSSLTEMLIFHNKYDSVTADQRLPIDSDRACLLFPPLMIMIGARSAQI